MAMERPSTALARRLGNELREHRETAGLTTAQAATALDCTKGKISRMENGRVLVRTPDVTALLAAYGIADLATHQRLSTLARSAHPRREARWWDEYASVLMDSYRDYIAMEALAGSIQTFQPQVIPGLLQTTEYARALTDTSHANRNPEQVEQFVKVRLRRQERLVSGDRPPMFHAVLAEGALWQRIVEPHLLADQLEHLARLAERPNISIQILPFTSGPHSCVLGPFLLLSFPDVTGIAVALCESPSGSMLRERDCDVAEVQSVFADAVDHALSPTESRALIRHIAEEHRR